MVKARSRTARAGTERARTARAFRPGGARGARLPLAATALVAAGGLVATVAAGCSDGAGAAPKITTTARAGIAPTPPAQGAYFGAWVPPAVGGAATRSPSSTASGTASESPSGTASGGPSGAASSGPTGKDADKPGMAPVAAFERDMGRQLDIVQSYRGWKSDFPTGLDSSVVDSNRYLLLTWAGADTKEIVQGKYDALIRARAKAIKATGKPVFLRWSRDMDRSSLKDRVHSPADFIAAWKHLRQIFTAEKVDNVAWVWCPSARGFGAPNAGAFYPGDDQVDWICADAPPGADYEYRDLSETLKLFMQWARNRHKPIMIAEFGVPKSYGQRRAEWLRAATKTLEDPQVKAVVYFDSDEQIEEPRDKRRAYSVTGDTHAVSALRELATTPYFNPRNLPVTSGG
ncbi:glycoside hydrolase family 26 protein [Actinomadura nitritigenes]|uniref:glycoside hydrolase family 26 protein n=1 Tax=Actinomadura nitritigenes TaxID=134602 RepID=UPI003D914323